MNYMLTSEVYHNQVKNHCNNISQELQSNTLRFLGLFSVQIIHNTTENLAIPASDKIAGLPEDRKNSFHLKKESSPRWQLHTFSDYEKLVKNVLL